MSTLFEPLLDALSLASPSLDDDRPPKRSRSDSVFAHLVLGSCLGETGVEARATPDDLRKGVLQAMFNAAADTGATESNRRKIYKLWREEADE